MTIALVGFAAMMLLSLSGIPIAFSMFIVGLVGFAYITDLSTSLAMAGQISWDTTLSYELSVLPMFILMGNFLTHARLSEELYDASNAFLSHRRGGLAMATIVAAGGFSAVSGSSLATAATMAKVAIPSMRKYGYHDSLAAGSVAAGGTLGNLIPPGTLFILYGIMTQTDIGKLLMAGVIPGIVTIFLYCGAIWLLVWWKPSLGPCGPRYGWPYRWRALKDIWGVIVLFAVVIGGLYLGVFTPTEAAAVGAIGAWIFVILRRGFSARLLINVCLESAKTSAVIFIVLIAALVFSNFVNVAGMSLAISQWVGGMSAPAWVIMTAIVFIYLLLGSVLEGPSMVLLTVPIFFPVVQKLGIDPIAFGVLVIVVTELAAISPPVGLNIFVIKSVFPDVDTWVAFSGTYPFLAAEAVVLILLISFPQLSLWLPSLMK